MEVSRHVYQSSQGGKTFCPLESDARIINHATPKFVRQVSSKYGCMASYQVEEDFKENHGRSISRNWIQQISQSVSNIIEYKESEWSYALPDQVDQTKVIAFSMDGTTTNMKGESWREVMSGTISFYNKEGDRLHSLYIGQSPEYGKSRFKARMSLEMSQVKALFPEATYVGIADGAVDNWSFLSPEVSHSIVDFWHVTEYLSMVSKVISRSRYEQKQWLEQRRHNLRHNQGAAESILREMKNLRRKKLTDSKKEKLERAITYYENHVHQMDYANYTAQKLPIGSGVTEAACKVLVKQKSCNSGMRWKTKGLQNVLNIRALQLTKNRWQQFWGHIDQLGYAA